MILIIKNILGILTDPKNIRMFLLGGIGILLFLLVRQCNETEEAKRLLDFKIIFRQLMILFLIM